MHLYNRIQICCAYTARPKQKGILNNCFMRKAPIFLILTILLCVLGTNQSFCQTKTWKGAGTTGGTSSSDFNNANNWNPVGVPTSTDNVTITVSAGTVVGVTGSVNIKSLTFSHSGANNNVTLSLGSNSFTVGGTVTLTGGTNDKRLAILTTTTGNISISGNLVGGTNSSFQLNNGTLNISGSLGLSPNIGTGQTGTINFNGTGQQTIPSFNYYNLTISGNRNGNVTFQNSGIIGIAGTFNPTATFTSGNYILTGSTIDFNGTSQTIPSFNFYNVSISNSGTKTVSGAVSVSNNLSLGAGSLNPASLLTLSNGASIIRTAGSLASAPTFGSSVNVTYNQHNSSITSGFEIPTDQAVLNNLTISNTNGVSLSAPTYVNGTVAFGSVNNTTLTTNNNLVFHTTATSVGRLADITNNGVNSGNSINGNVTVERYIAGRRAYRQLAAGVNTTGSIRANWQNGGSSDLHNGIHITGSTTGANGFDATGSGAANMFTYTPGSPNYTAIANTDVLTLNALQGYRVFVYGDRGENLSVANTVTSGSTTTNKDFDNAYTVLKATGTLVTGTVTYNSTSSVPLGTATGSYSLIANPYWSPVSFDALAKSGIDATYWVWDPTVGNRGAYISWTTGSGSAGGLTTNIQPGQAIFVRTNGASPSLTFSESNKTSTQSTKGFRLNNTVPGKITVQLFENSRLQNNQQMQDATAVAFDEAFAATIGNEDAAKFANSDENIGIVRDAQLLGVEGRPLADGDVIPLRISRLISNYSYSLKLNGENLPAGTEATLEDLYDNKTYPINVTGTTVVPFSFNSSDNATFYERFRIVMKKGQAAPLPFSFTNLTAIKQGGKIQLDWSVANETGVTSYEVERSTDGVNYTVIGTVNTIANNGSSNSYTYTDAAPFSKNSYRIKANLATEVKYSNTVTIAMGGGKGQQQLLVYPNPVAGRGVRVQMNELASGNYVVRLYNPSGQQIYQKQVSHQGGAFSMPLQIPHASVGMYTIEVSGAATQIKERIIVQQ
jgi:hypothetical protein